MDFYQIDANINDHQRLKFKNYFKSISNFYWNAIYLIIYIICFILILNQCQNQSFRFNMSFLSSSNEIIRRSRSLSKILVISHINEDLDWIDIQIGMEIPHIVYSHSRDPLLRHRILNNKGREATAYLQYIIDYYSNLSSLIAFLPAHRQQQPNPVIALRALQWDKYVYMPLTSSIIETTFKLNSANEQTTVNYQLWKDVLQDELGPPPKKGVKTHCCATFVVRKEAILAHSKQFYIRIYDYIISNHSSDILKAKTLEYVWHMIFGQPADINYKTCDIFVCDSNGTISVPLAEKTLTK